MVVTVITKTSAIRTRTFVWPVNSIINFSNSSVFRLFQIFSWKILRDLGSSTGNNFLTNFVTFGITRNTDNMPFFNFVRVFQRRSFEILLMDKMNCCFAQTSFSVYSERQTFDGWKLQFLCYVKIMTLFLQFLVSLKPSVNRKCNAKFCQTQDFQQLQIQENRQKDLFPIVKVDLVF